MRQIVLDTETTGLDPAQGHRIIEIGAIEIVDRRVTTRRFQQYLQPDREIDEGALEVHGITDAFLADKPRFGDIVDDLLEFIKDAEVIIHNAPFDIGFINHELALLKQGRKPFTDYCTVLDSLALARQLHPGQRNSLDALCKRYQVDNSQRELHGALLDAEILSDVYLAMTGGQATLSLDGRLTSAGVAQSGVRRVTAERARLPVIPASAEEEEAHRHYLDRIARESGGVCVWKLH
ncbi:MAG: DNA polymerase III subunit epsilon [Gammaproteobacteria bacterium]|nr:MAG: DNA polymerase III subunit epsilon [Gammaproteobacteria bacterium]TND02141.1 MAG: DNA polymerase III subunit epsilon [Gammaproteobacteria bacterium]